MFRHKCLLPSATPEGGGREEAVAWRFESIPSAEKGVKVSVERLRV